MLAVLVAIAESSAHQHSYLYKYLIYHRCVALVFSGAARLAACCLAVTPL